MKTRQGYVQGYNAQAVVSEEQIIVAVGVTQEANDVQQLEPMLQTMAHTLEAAGIEDRPKAGLADAGYWSEANIRACSSQCALDSDGLLVLSFLMGAVPPLWASCPFAQR